MFENYWFSRAIISSLLYQRINNWYESCKTWCKLQNDAISFEFEVDSQKLLKYEINCLEKWQLSWCDNWVETH